MRIAIIIIFTLSISLTSAQESGKSEKEMSDKANAYFDAWDNGDSVGLTENDIICNKESDEELEGKYYVSKAYNYYKELIEKYPDSKEYVSYLYKKGILAIELNNTEEGKKLLLKVVEINKSTYYSKLSLYHLMRSTENDCEVARKYINQQNEIQSNLLNEYQKSYIEDEMERINRLCAK